MFVQLFVLSAFKLINILTSTINADEADNTRSCTYKSYLELIRWIERIAGVFEINRFGQKTVILQFNIAHTSILPLTGIVPPRILFENSHGDINISTSLKPWNFSTPWNFLDSLCYQDRESEEPPWFCSKNLRQNCLWMY